MSNVNHTTFTDTCVFLFIFAEELLFEPVVGHTGMILLQLAEVVAYSARSQASAAMCMISALFWDITQR
jgi:hypothetical protein